MVKIIQFVKPYRRQLPIGCPLSASNAAQPLDPSAMPPWHADGRLRSACPWGWLLAMLTTAACIAQSLWYESATGWFRLGDDTRQPDDTGLRKGEMPSPGDRQTRSAITTVGDPQMRLRQEQNGLRADAASRETPQAMPWMESNINTFIWNLNNEELEYRQWGPHPTSQLSPGRILPKPSTVKRRPISAYGPRRYGWYSRAVPHIAVWPVRSGCCCSSHCLR